ncbi:hypothetical protein BDQ12DRAFT_582627, partial [Crucibulum laeve]
MSEKERAELLAANKCFRCKEVGHLARNCPKANMVASSSSKPPGKSALHNIQPELASDEEDEEIEVLHGLPLGMIELRTPLGTSTPHEQDWFEYVPERRPRRYMGDALAMMAEYVLNDSQPYPGDETNPEAASPAQQYRFDMVQKLPEWHCIYDRVTEFDIDIPTHLLENRHFCLADWYANLRAHFLDL